MGRNQGERRKRRRQRNNPPTLVAFGATRQRCWTVAAWSTALAILTCNLPTARSFSVRLPPRTATPLHQRKTPVLPIAVLHTSATSSATDTSGGGTSEPRREADNADSKAPTAGVEPLSNTSWRDRLLRALNGEVDMAAYASGYTTVREEVPFRICQAAEPESNPIPSDLRGSYFRAGPAMFTAGSIIPPKTSLVQPRSPPVSDGVDRTRTVLHPMEGDGAVLGITFADPDAEEEANDDATNSVVVARFRYVRTPGFTNERKRGRRLYSAMDSTRRRQPSSSDTGNKDKGVWSSEANLGNDFPLPLFRHHLRPGLGKHRKHTANTRAIHFGKRLFALWEGGQPYKLDGRALSTEGRSRLGGAIPTDDDPCGGNMAYDASSDRAVFYGVQHGPVKSELHVYEFDSDFRLVPGGRRIADVPGFALVTDVAVTEHYAVFILPTVECDPVRFLVDPEPGLTLRVAPSGGSIALVPRPTISSNTVSGGFSSSSSSSNNNNIAKAAVVQPIVIPIPPDAAASDAHVLLINAYEDPSPRNGPPGEARIVVDVIRSDGSSKTPIGSSSSSSSSSSSTTTAWPWATTMEEYRALASRKSLWRYEIDVKDRTVTKTPLLSSLGGKGPHVDYGVINPARSGLPHRYIYTNVGRDAEGYASPMQGVLKLDATTGEAVVWMPERHQFCGEPAYAPRTSSTSTSSNKPVDEDDGYLLTVLYDGHRRESELVVLLASDVAAGPVSRIPLGLGIPHGCFGCFAPGREAQWSADEIERRAKLADKVESRGNRWNEVKSDFSGLGLRLDDMEEYFGDMFS